MTTGRFANNHLMCSNDANLSSVLSSRLCELHGFGGLRRDSLGSGTLFPQSHQWRIAFLTPSCFRIAISGHEGAIRLFLRQRGGD